MSGLLLISNKMQYYDIVHNVQGKTLGKIVIKVLLDFPSIQAGFVHDTEPPIRKGWLCIK